MFKKRLVIFLVIVSIISSTSYLPTFAPRAEAQFGIPEYGWDLEDITWNIMKKVAIGIAQKMVNDIVRSTINWAQTGFQGNPAYATDPGQYFQDMADGLAGDFISAGAQTSFLCSPFQIQVRLALQRQYTQPTTFQCTLTGVVGNINAFYSDFSQGGWDGWFSMTQNNANNPYGAFINAQVELDRRLAKALGVEDRKLNWSDGFLSWTDPAECKNWEKLVVPDPQNPGRTIYVNGKCLEPGPTKTPGTTIKSQLDKVLSSGFEQIISAKQIDELVGAFASGLLNRYVFSNDGLFAGNSAAASSKDIIDIDNDGVPDGWDNNGDGQLDICHHGLKPNLPPRSLPNNTNCFGSTEVHNSPYFIPICEALAQAIQELEKYQDFVWRNTFSKIYSNTWTNRTVTANGAVENLESAVGRYEIMAYDPALFTIGKYIKFMDDRIESLVDDAFMDQSEVDLIRKNTDNLLIYLKTFMTSIGQCDAPNTGAIGNIPAPIIEEYVPGAPPPPGSTVAPNIIASIDLGSGTFPDPVYHNGKIYIAVQQGPAIGSQLNLYSFDPDLSNQQVQQIPFSGVGLAFQRIAVHNGILWVIFRDGENSVGTIPESIRLWRSDTGAVENLGNVVGSGNDPVAIGNGYIAWQNQVGGTITIFRRSVTGGTISNLGAGAPTGLSRIMPGGQIVLIDTDRNVYPWGTRFWFAGALNVAEDFTPPPDNGVVGRFNNDPATEFNLWPTQVAHTPHAATDGSGSYIITTWNPTVRAAVIR